MPATTVASLQAALATPAATNNATFFLEPGASFLAALNEVGPRVYSMGMWRDLLVEQTYSGADGYFSLDRDIEAIIDGNVNDSPSRLRSQFHDKAFWDARDTRLPATFGLVDQGYHPSRRDIQTIQDADTLSDVTPVTELFITTLNGAAVTETSLSTTLLTVVGIAADQSKVTGTISGGSNAVVQFSPGIVKMESITASSLPQPVELRTSASDAESNVATVLAPSDVVRYRRFRVGGYRSDTYAHILAKRAWANVTAGTNIVYLGNLAAWKHALLAKVAEDNGDFERAQYHWGQCRSALDDERDAQRGGARPVLRIDLYGGAAGGIRNVM
jgi:hypothetical protein